ncbi:hypothetical protein [uncultured Amaricoccus sp.]|uniref:hypothetical protein n=1 Tax=uncultured Amaricoccus sp. TaxID=339341 RepID=UPI002624378D|nr:hypothetical protein [uncultured Amaricoccus sp.]HRO27395.1 hypothetical protein [Luteimonas sp.]
MSALRLRWADAGTAAAWFQLRDLAPRLAALVHCPVPDRQLHVVLDWVDQLALPDAGPALALDRLREVLPAMTTCFVGAHTYAVTPASAGRGEALELHDPDGCGRVVGRVLPLLSMITMSLHGAEGDRLVKAVHADLVRMLERIWAVGR